MKMEKYKIFDKIGPLVISFIKTPQKTIKGRLSNPPKTKK